MLEHNFPDTPKLTDGRRMEYHKTKCYNHINAYHFYKEDSKTNTYVFAGDEAYNLLDNTLVHEMMHGFMVDYTRSGMTGMQYDSETGKYSYDNKTLWPQGFQGSR